MLHTRMGSNGFEVSRYEAGKVYDIADSLAADFLRNGLAFNYEDEVEPVEIKSVGEILLDAFKPRIITNPSTYEALGKDI